VHPVLKRKIAIHTDETSEEGPAWVVVFQRFAEELRDNAGVRDGRSASQRPHSRPRADGRVIPRPSAL
jgi:hypothetical protein